MLLFFFRDFSPVWREKMARNIRLHHTLEIVSYPATEPTINAWNFWNVGSAAGYIDRSQILNLDFFVVVFYCLAVLANSSRTECRSNASAFPDQDWPNTTKLAAG